MTCNNHLIEWKIKGYMWFILNGLYMDNKSIELQYDGRTFSIAEHGHVDMYIYYNCFESNPWDPYPKVADFLMDL